ncbi:MAG: hypothetical protein ACI4PO_01195, partial [Faecousia sp.]
THVEAKEPTCTEDGNVEHWHCETCGKNYADAEGKTELNSVVVPAKGHGLTHVEAKEPTTTEDGNVEYWHCDKCGKNFADAEGTEVLKNVVIPATGESPDTGDIFRPALVCGMLILSLAAIAAMAYSVRRKEQN